MLFYLVACMINVLLDMVVTYYTALKIMVGLDFRTISGQRVAEIESFTEQFETYAMQRSLAENTYRYAPEVCGRIWGTITMLELLD